VEEARRDAGVSSEDVDVVRMVMEAFARRDAAALRELQDPAFEFRSVLADLAGGSYRAGEVERYFADIDEQLGDWHTEDETYAEARDGRVLVMYRVAGRGRQSGFPLDQEMAMLWTLRGGKLLFAETFLNLSEALQEAGLEALDPLRKVNDAISAGELGRASVLLHPDVVWEHNLGVGSPEEGVYRGREDVLRLLERIIEPWEVMRPHPDHIRVLEDGSFLLIGHLHAKHATSQTEVVAPYEQQLEMRDGLPVRGRMTTGGMSDAGAAWGQTA
jgi:ketosteroid isomerase-like protein